MPTSRTLTDVRRPMLTRFSSRPVNCVRIGSLAAIAGGTCAARTAAVPRPGSRTIRPSAASCSSARRTVTRATPNWLHQCEFARQAPVEAPFLQLLAQHEVDAGGTWAGTRRKPSGILGFGRMSCQWDICAPGEQELLLELLAAAGPDRRVEHRGTVSSPRQAAG